MKTEKLELKHLAPYLPYGLQMKVNDGFGELIGINKNFLDISDPESVDSGMYVSYGECKPLLIPISECEDQLNNDDYLCVDSCHCQMYKNFNHKYLIKIYPTQAEWVYASDVYENFYEFFFRHHYDVFNLIDAGLAINKLIL